jgi:hypothetical protein
MVRSVPIKPSATWGGQGLLGVSIRFCSFQNAAENVWRILDVHPNSPAERAGLVAFNDYVIGADSVLHEAEDFFSLVDAHQTRPLKLYVYNLDSDQCRDVTITPDASWGGEGSLGCGIGYGYLHRIPHNIIREEAPKPKKTFSSALGIDASAEATAEISASSVFMTSPGAPTNPQGGAGPGPGEQTNGIGTGETVPSAPPQTITTPLSIPGMPPITVSATLVGLTQPSEAPMNLNTMTSVAAPVSSTTAAVSAAFSPYQTSSAPPLSSTMTTSTSAWGHPPPPQTAYVPPSMPGFPPPGGYYQPKPATVPTDHFHPQHQHAHSHPPPVQNISLFNPVANSTPTSTAPPQAQEAGNFIRMYDPSAHNPASIQPQPLNP